MFDSATQRYIETAAAHGDAVAAGDAKSAKAASDLMAAALRDLQSRSDQGRTALTWMQEHEDKSIRLWAAKHLLPLDARCATATLQLLARDEGPVAVEASLVLAEWRGQRHVLP